jgi:hypothetical protein
VLLVTPWMCHRSHRPDHRTHVAIRSLRRRWTCRTAGVASMVRARAPVRKPIPHPLQCWRTRAVRSADGRPHGPRATVPKHGWVGGQRGPASHPRSASWPCSTIGCRSTKSRLSAASTTSPTTGCGCYCIAESGGRLTEPQDCKAAPLAWWPRAQLRSRRQMQGMLSPVTWPSAWKLVTAWTYVAISV